MSYQAYLDALEKKTGKTPQQLLDEAAARGYEPTTKAGVVVDWLKEEYGVGGTRAARRLDRPAPRRVGDPATRRDRRAQLIGGSAQLSTRRSRQLCCGS